jgi:hypothetical protein
MRTDDDLPRAERKVKLEVKGYQITKAMRIISLRLIWYNSYFLLPPYKSLSAKRIGAE